MSATLLSSLSAQELTDFLKSIDTVLIDCDGVIWIDNEPMQGATEVLDKFRNMGKRIFYVTNNSKKTREELVEKCTHLGFTASEDEVLCCSYLTACYLSDMGFKGKAFVIGSMGLCKELDAFGIKHTEIGPDCLNSDLAVYVKQFKKDPEISAVVIGNDEHYSYIKLLKASSYLKDPNCIFVATNTDERCPTKTDLVIPGTGSIVYSVEACAGRKAFIIGKPSNYISEVLAKNYNVDPKKTLIIGDRGNTDILLGTLCGFKTLLVLSGVTNLEEVRTWQNSEDKRLRNCVPDYYLNILGDLIDLLNCVCPAVLKSSK